MRTDDNSFLKAALRYAELGYRVFPCAPGRKTPLTEHGFHDASTDPERIEQWWAQHPTANIGLATEGLVVVDVDGGANSWLRDEPDKQYDLAAAPTAVTPRGGRHHIFRQPAGRHWRCTESRLASKVDTRADGGYIVVTPSVLASGKQYRWAPGLELDETPEQLHEPPPWLVVLLDELANRSPTSPHIAPATPEANQISEGRRNTTLTKLAGAMRRVGFSQAEITAPLLQVNTNRCVPPLPNSEVEKIAASVARYTPDAAAVARVEGIDEDASEVLVAPLAPISLGDLVSRHPDLRPPVVHGLLRRGETMNVISSSKIGKSWLVADLALAVATGGSWLDTFATAPGDVLILDNELHGETIAHRLHQVAVARQVSLDDIGRRVFIQNLRGRLLDVFTLESYFLSLEPGRFKLIVLDAFYRFLPPGTDENDNARMAQVYNRLDSYADFLGCCFVPVHHASKGSQSGKAITDVGAGAGSQSRATDTHLVLRPHEQDDVVVLEAAVRSWPPVVPRCLRWSFPVWTLVDDLDPMLLRSEKSRRRDASSKRVVKSTDAAWTTASFVERFVAPEPKPRASILQAAEDAGVSGRQAASLLQLAQQEGLIFVWSEGRNRASRFATVAPPDLNGEGGDR